MCGRFTLTIDPYDLRERLDLGDIPQDMQPRYNISPGELVPVVNDGITRNVHYMSWGLVPHWSKDRTIGYKMINARSETLSEKPAFRASFANKRCLILADGFYEWKKPVRSMNQSIPYYVRLVANQPFAFAGIWDRWKTQEGADFLSCSIITCRANNYLQPIHERMPLILEKSQMELWINHDAPMNELNRLMSPLDDAKLIAYPVSTIVNRPGNNSPDCIVPTRDRFWVHPNHLLE